MGISCKETIAVSERTSSRYKFTFLVSDWPRILNRAQLSPLLSALTFLVFIHRSVYFSIMYNNEKSEITLVTNDREFAK